MTRRPPRSATIGRSALVGAARGVLLGLLFGLVSAIFFTTAGLFLGLVLFSVAVGLIFGVIGALECARTQRSPSVNPGLSRARRTADIAESARAPAAAPRHISVPVQRLDREATRGCRTQS